MSTIEPDFEEVPRQRPPARRSARVAALLVLLGVLCLALLVLGAVAGVVLREFKLVAGI